jgi:hypothetical protein
MKTVAHIDTPEVMESNSYNKIDSSWVFEFQRDNPSMRGGRQQRHAKGQDFLVRFDKCGRLLSLSASAVGRQVFWLLSDTWPDN